MFVMQLMVSEKNKTKKTLHCGVISFKECDTESENDSGDLDSKSDHTLCNLQCSIKTWIFDGYI
jgi:hypothetical protein